MGGKTAVRKHAEAKRAVSYVESLGEAKTPDITDVLHDTINRNLGTFMTPEQVQHRDAILPAIPAENPNRAGAERPPEIPTLVVSAQLAAVLNMGIDRAVDVANETANRVQHLEYVIDNGREHNRRLREFIRNVATGDWSKEDIVWGALRVLGLEGEL